MEAKAFELETGKLDQSTFQNGSEFRVDIEATALVKRVFTREVLPCTWCTANVQGVISASESIYSICLDLQEEQGNIAILELVCECDNLRGQA